MGVYVIIIIIIIITTIVTCPSLLEDVGVRVPVKSFGDSTFYISRNN
jgi:hypothetical protein